jgi:hypothetical protein
MDAHSSSRASCSWISPEGRDIFIKVFCPKMSRFITPKEIIGTFPVHLVVELTISTHDPRVSHDFSST